MYIIAVNSNTFKALVNLGKHQILYKKDFLKFRINIIHIDIGSWTIMDMSHTK